MQSHKVTERCWQKINTALNIGKWQFCFHPTFSDHTNLPWYTLLHRASVSSEQLGELLNFKPYVFTTTLLVCALIPDRDTAWFPVTSLLTAWSDRIVHLHPGGDVQPFNVPGTRVKKAEQGVLSGGHQGIAEVETFKVVWIYVTKA